MLAVMPVKSGLRSYGGLLLMRGFSEVDDVMHNTVGCLIGFGFITILRLIFKIRYKNV